jgi:ubiquinone/menaquinone biosynthesis C-methylase UbiE
MTLELTARVAPGEVVGLDLETRVPDQARASAVAQAVDNVRFEQGDVYALPFADGSFDALFSHALISHLGEPAPAVAEMRQVLSVQPADPAAAAEAYVYILERTLTVEFAEDGARHSFHADQAYLQARLLAPGPQRRHDHAAFSRPLCGRGRGAGHPSSAERQTSPRVAAHATSR